MKFIISSVFVAAAPIAATSWKDSFDLTNNKNLPEQDLVACTIQGDITKDDEKMQQCAGECLDNKACVGLVFHPWGTMLKDSSKNQADRDKFQTWIMKEIVQECAIIHSKCGGENKDGTAWAGPTCCRPDYQNYDQKQIKETHCVSQGKWYSQCVDKDLKTVTEYARATNPEPAAQPAPAPAPEAKDKVDPTVVV